MRRASDAGLCRNRVANAPTTLSLLVSTFRLEGDTCRRIFLLHALVALIERASMSGMGVRRCASRGAGARPALRGHTSARARAGSRRPNCCSRRRRRWCAVDRSGRARRAGVGAHRRGPRGACAVPQRLAAAATGRSRRMGQITHQRRNRPPSALAVLPPPKLEPPESASAPPPLTPRNSYGGSDGPRTSFAFV